MCLKDKSEAFQKFKWYLASVEKETRKKLKCLRSHRGFKFYQMDVKFAFLNGILEEEVS